jgi:hypothetical protein
MLSHRRAWNRYFRDTLSPERGSECCRTTCNPRSALAVGPAAANPTMNGTGQGWLALDIAGVRAASRLMEQLTYGSQKMWARRAAIWDQINEASCEHEVEAAINEIVRLVLDCPRFPGAGLLNMAQRKLILMRESRYDHATMYVSDYRKSDAFTDLPQSGSS